MNQYRGRLTVSNLKYCNKEAPGHDYLNKMTSALEGNIFDIQITSGKLFVTSPPPKKKDHMKKYWNFDMSASVSCSTKWAKCHIQEPAASTGTVTISLCSAGTLAGRSDSHTRQPCSTQLHTHCYERILFLCTTENRHTSKLTDLPTSYDNLRFPSFFQQHGYFTTSLGRLQPSVMIYSFWVVTCNLKTSPTQLCFNPALCSSA